MLYAFGTFMIASSQQIAKQLVFVPVNKQYKYKVVTLDGDIYDPSGTLTGGYIQQ